MRQRRPRNGGCLQAEASGLRGENEGRAAGEGTAEGAGLVQGLVDIDAHDFDQGFSDGEEIDAMAQSSVWRRQQAEGAIALGLHQVAKV